jgi:hypothetical protein
MLHLTDVGAPVGKEHHALVHLHPLAFQKLEETALRLFVIRLDESEATTRSILGHRFADDHFEVRLLVFPLPHIATVNADRQRRLGTRQCCPLPGAALNETYPFIAQGCFCSFSDPVQVIAYTGRIERFSYRQRVLEQVRGQFKGDQRSPFGLQWFGWHPQ